MVSNQLVSNRIVLASTIIALDINKQMSKNNNAQVIQTINKNRDHIDCIRKTRENGKITLENAVEVDITCISCVRSCLMDV